MSFQPATAYQPVSHSVQLADDDDAPRLKTLFGGEWPDLVRAKFRASEDAAIRTRAEMRVTQEQANAFRDKRDALQTKIGMMERDKSLSPVWPERNEQALQEARRELDEVKARLHEFQPATSQTPDVTDPKAKRQNRLRNEWLTKLNPLVEAWANAQRASARYVVQRAELPKGDLKKALANVRADQKAVLDRLVAIEDLPVDLESALGTMKARVAEMAERGTPDATQLLYIAPRYNHGGNKAPGDIKWPVENIFNSNLTDSGEGELGVSFCVWLFRAEVERQLEKQIRKQLEGKETLSVPARELEQAELSAKYLELQRLEVRICEELGLPIPRVHPEAFFEIVRADDSAEPNVGAGTAYRGVDKHASPTIGVPIKAAGGK